ncbi:hypothetical protein, partial [Photobacterium damselae]|uniref:hypothetical protein n=1 Tax=Photobacterium damselae TaxID=38293 RepID=UPI002F41E181
MFFEGTTLLTLLPVYFSAVCYWCRADNKEPILLSGVSQSNAAFSFLAICNFLLFSLSDTSLIFYLTIT